MSEPPVLPLRFMLDRARAELQHVWGQGAAVRLRSSQHRKAPAQATTWAPGHVAHLDSTPNGQYKVTVVGISTKHADRVFVEVTGILALARHFKAGPPSTRRGYREGEFLSVEARSLAPSNGTATPTYLQTLQDALTKRQQAIALNETLPLARRQNLWMQSHEARSLELVIEAEELRLETGTWRVGDGANL